MRETNTAPQTKIQLKTKTSRNDRKLLFVKCALSNIHPGTQEPATLRVNGIEKAWHRGYTPGSPTDWTEWDENNTVTIELVNGYAAYCFGDVDEILISWIPFEKGVPLTFYNTNRDLASITLDLGEPLVEKNTNTVIIGKTDSTSADNTENTIVLGASKTELGDVEDVKEGSVTTGQQIEIKHIDNIVRSSYTLKTKGAKLSKSDDTIEIDANYVLSITHDDTNNETSITLTPPQGTAISGTIADPDWDTKVLNRPVVHWVGDDIDDSNKSSVIESITTDEFTYIDGKNESDIHHYDICIHKQKIGSTTNHYEHTVYIYYENKGWQKLDFEYDANKIIMPRNISLTTNFGNYTGSKTTLGTLPCEGKSIADMLDDAFGGDDTTVWQTTPSATATANVSNSTAEVGETIRFNYVVTLNAGTYKHGTITGNTANFNDKTTGIQYSTVSGSYVAGNLVSNGATLATYDKIVVEGANSHKFTGQTIYRSAVEQASKHPCSLKGKDVYSSLAAEYKSEKACDLEDKSNSCTGYRYWYVATNATDARTTCAVSNKYEGSSWELNAVTSRSVITAAGRSTKQLRLYTYDDFNKSWEPIDWTATEEIYVRPENKRQTEGNGEVVYDISGPDTDKYKYYTYAVTSSATYKVTISS